MRHTLLLVCLATGCDGVLSGSGYDAPGPARDVPSAAMDAPTPGLDAPGVDVPGLDAPGVDASMRPGTDAPVADTPMRRDAPRSDAPRSDAPADTPPPERCAGGPLAAPIPGCMPTPMASTGDPAEDCFRRINQFRAECQCLPPLARWTGGEACADQDAEYDSTRTPHAGFSAGICSSGFAQNECPGWPSIESTVSGCLQQMWDEGPGTPFSAHGHYINMTNPSYSEVACGFYTTPSGDVWAVQNFR